MAKHRGRRSGSRVEDPELQAWSAANAREVVPELLEGNDVSLIPEAIVRGHDDDFAAGLVDHELSLIADGETPPRISFQIEVILAAREALMLCAEIREPPETWAPHLPADADDRGRDGAPASPPSVAGRRVTG